MHSKALQRNNSITAFPEFQGAAAQILLDCLQKFAFGVRFVFVLFASCARPKTNRKKLFGFVHETQKSYTLLVFVQEKMFVLVPGFRSRIRNTTFLVRARNLEIVYTISVFAKKDIARTCSWVSLMNQNSLLFPHVQLMAFHVMHNKLC